MSPSAPASDDLRRAIEAILFVSDEPLASAVIAQAVGTDRRTTEQMLGDLQRSLEERGSGLVVREIAGGWRLATNPDVAPQVESFVLANRHARLTKASLETLAIIAYKQPVTRHQIAAIRGVNSDGVLKSLADRGLIVEVGREDVPGRPVLYGTTPEFLERLGLPSLASLPPLAPLLDAVEGDDEEPAPEDGEPADPDEAEAEADAVHAAVTDALGEGEEDVAPAGSLGDMAELGGAETAPDADPSAE